MWLPFDELYRSREPSRLWQDARPIHHAAISCGNYFFTNKVKAYYFWALSFIKMATHGVAYLIAQTLQIICFRKDWSAKRTGNEPALGRIFNKEN